MSRALFLGRLANLGRRIADALEFFPFTIVYLLARAARDPVSAAERGAVGEAGEELPRSTLRWLALAMKRHPVGPVDISLRLPRAGSGTGVPDALSAALAFPRVRSIELAWDDGVAPSSLKGGDERLPTGDFEPPLAAARDAQTLFKRLAGGAPVVLVNLPAALAAARPDVHCFRLEAGWGFTLHERLALVCAADAYIGAPDELGCAALISGRPALLATGPAPGEVAEFLARHFGAVPATPARSSTSPGS